MQGMHTLVLMGDTRTSANVTDERGDKDKGGRPGRTPDKLDKQGDQPRREPRRKESPDGKGMSGAPVTPVGKRNRTKGNMAIGSSNDKVDYTKKCFFKLGLIQSV